MAPDLKNLPSFDELPPFHAFTGCAWEIWGKDDQLGTINLLTPEVVAKAAQEEVKSGKAVSLNWPVNFPSKPVFGRKPPHHIIIDKPGEKSMVRDDEIHINTQSGSQWDGLKHYGIRKHGVFYNNHPPEALTTGYHPFDDPTKIDPELIKLGIHNWAQHGICGRGVLLDLVKFFTKDGSPLPYHPFYTHGITAVELEACAKYQGVSFRQGDILLLRVGFIQQYYASSQAEKDDLKNKEFAGIEPDEDMKRFLWNNHFAAVASDQPALEKCPQPGGLVMHQTLLGLWGMPIGEFFDLEALSKQCAETGRYTFFFTSWPLNLLGGVASPPNAAAYF